ncbi:MAG: DUF2017 family protein [Opitutaceae bacterium]|nr:DUF2017 family protein [Opitutaceae bacterium]
MKRIEVKLSLPVVAPLLDVIKELDADLRQNLAAPLAINDLEADFHGTWVDELLAGQNEDVRILLALFNEEFFSEGVISIDEDNAEHVVRACAAVRLVLRARHLQQMDEETLESGEVDLAKLSDPTRRSFMCYLFLATLQELIIQHLDSSIIGS